MNSGPTDIDVTDPLPQNWRHGARCIVITLHFWPTNNHVFSKSTVAFALKSRARRRCCAY